MMKFFRCFWVVCRVCFSVFSMEQIFMEIQISRFSRIKYSKNIMSYNNNFYARNIKHRTKLINFSCIKLDQIKLPLYLSNLCKSADDVHELNTTCFQTTYQTLQISFLRPHFVKIWGKMAKILIILNRLYWNKAGQIRRIIVVNNILLLLPSSAC
jgi:hypothetical protein